MKKLALIVGPTASGKTVLSVDVAKRLGAEVISADSVQLYRGMDIGSAKPAREEMGGVTHHMMDCFSPDAPVTVAEYKRLASEAIDGVSARGALPLVVGGTGLYVNALISPLDFTDAGVDEAFRDEWRAREEREPGCAHARLAEVDGPSAARLHPNDKKRVIRALEVHHLTGRPLSEQSGGFRKAESPYALSMTGLTMPRELLYARIEQRVDAMIDAGLVGEVEELLRAGYDPALPSMQGLGYKETAAYLAGNCTLEEAVETIKRDTRRFAKRQLTWFRRDERIRWYDVTQYAPGELAEAVASGIVKELGL